MGVCDGRAMVTRRAGSSWRLRTNRGSVGPTCLHNSSGACAIRRTGLNRGHGRPLPAIQACLRGCRLQQLARKRRVAAFRMILVACTARSAGRNRQRMSCGWQSSTVDATTSAAGTELLARGYPKRHRRPEAGVRQRLVPVAAAMGSGNSPAGRGPRRLWRGVEPV